MTPNNQTAKNASLALTPLGAGDLIDRAVRLYRQNFFTLLRIAALPVVVMSVGSVLTTVGWRGFYATDAEAAFAVYFLLMTVGVVLSIVGVLLILMVMGGAARNLVRHLLWGEPVSVYETLQSVRGRFFSLLFVTLIVVTVALTVGIAIAYGGLMLFGIAFLIGALLYSVSPFFGILIGVLLSLASVLLTVWLYFLIIGRFAYVWQILLVENQGVFAAIGRSLSLASGNATRLATLFLFTISASASAVMIFLVPLYWYAEANGITLNLYDEDALPLWYSVAFQVILQLSVILIAPILMLGLSLLYVDERVRQEAYDVELMAARALGEMPALVNPQYNPLRPALGAQQVLPANFNAPARNNSTLGLG